MMRRCLPLIILSVVLVSTSLAFADYVGPTKNGLSFEATRTPIWLYVKGRKLDPGELFPSEATITVRVRNAMKQPANEVPVTFEVAPDCQGHVLLTPDRVLTQDGVAQASFAAQDMPGFCDVHVQVGNLTQEITFNIRKRPHRTGSGPVQQN